MSGEGLALHTTGGQLGSVPQPTRPGALLPDLTLHCPLSSSIPGARSWVWATSLSLAWPINIYQPLYKCMELTFEGVQEPGKSGCF